MRIDSTTLADLEVFGRAGAGGLLDLIDRTKTSRGRAALWRRLPSPPTDLSSILATQDAVRFLHRQPDLRPFDEPGIMALERYILSNIAVAPRSVVRSRVEYAWLSMRYPDILKEIAAGVGKTFEIFARLARVCDDIAPLGPPVELEQLIERLRATSCAVLATVERGS